MDFEEQLRAFAGSSLVILTHGAAMANLMFIPKVRFASALTLRYQTICAGLFTRRQQWQQSSEWCVS